MVLSGLLKLLRGVSTVSSRHLYSRLPVAWGAETGVKVVLIVLRMKLSLT